MTPPDSEASCAFKALNGYAADQGSEWHLDSSVILHGNPVQLFRSMDGSVGMIIPTSEEELQSFIPDRQSSAISLTRLWQDEEPQVRLTLHDAAQQTIFELLVNDVLELLKQQPRTPARLVADFLRRWRRLFSAQPKQWLSPSTEIGLLCELEVLESMLSSGYALASWTGPNLQPHDFEIAGRSIECKATASPHDLVVEIHGVQQLQPLPGKELRLVVRQYQRDPSGPFSVRSMCDRILSFPQIETDIFLEKLELLGGNPYYEELEQEFGSYSPLGSFEFDVTSDFPRIDRVGAADRIQALRYQLNLTDPSAVPGYTENDLILGGSR